MLLKHSAAYLLARGVPGIINFLALALYTHLLSPAGYGRYALIVAVSGLGSAVLFQWLRLGLLRFLPSSQQERAAFLSTLATGYLALVACTALLGGAAITFTHDTALRALILVALLLTWAQAWFELNSELMRAQLSPVKYGVLALLRAALSLGLGGALVKLGLGATGLLAGALAGALLPALLVSTREWRGVRPTSIDPVILRQLLRYGLPLTLTFALGFIVSSSDRLLLGYFKGAGAAGVYAVGYDLAQQTLVMLMMVVNLAAYPLAVRALAEQGEDAARRQLERNGSLLLAIAVPAAVGLALLAPQLGHVMLGPSFAGAATRLIPWIALGALLAGLKAYHFDLSFQLGQKTSRQVWIVLAAATVNLALNLWWIPRYSYMASAYAAVIAYGIALVLSWWWGKKCFAVPLPLLDLGPVILGTLALCGALLLLAGWRGPVALAVQVLAGGGAYLLVFLLSSRTYRTKLARILVKFTQAKDLHYEA